MSSSDLLVLSIEERVSSKNQKPFLDLKVRLPNGHPLRTNRDSINAKIWDNAIQKNNIPAAGRIIAADYKEEEWQGEPQLIINLYSVRDSEFPKDLFIPAPAVDQDAVYNKLFYYQWLSSDMNRFFTNVRIFFLEVNEGKWRKKLYEIPAGASNHHSRRAGLLQHLEEIWDFAVLLMGIQEQPKTLLASIPHFPDLLDWELVLAGILLHDLGKVHDYSAETYGYDEDRISALYGHSCWGALLTQKCWPIEGDHDRGERLVHIVLSHHGSPSTGAAIEAKIPEAILVHLLDSMSARMDICRKAYIASKDGSSPGYSKPFGCTPVTPTWPPRSK